MRISDEERRETVENLRCLSYTNRVRYKEEFYELLDETVMEPDTGYHEMNDVFERIADLIDRPTCHLIEDKDGRTACSECGCAALYLSDATYCPDCGGVIVDD
jgi:hypothetical protein